jgi:hypothetical protein
MATSSRKHLTPHWTQYLLPVQTLNDMQNLARRFQEGRGLQAYVLEHKLQLIPLVIAILLVSVSCAVAPVVYLSEMHRLLALPALLLIPVILIGSLLLLLHVMFSWLENRALARELGHSIKPVPGSLAAWLTHRTGKDFSTLPRIPWILAAILVFAPLAMVASFSLGAALVLVLVLVAAPVVFVAFDR